MTTLDIVGSVLLLATMAYTFYKFIQLMNAGIRYFETGTKAREADSKAYQEHIKEKTECQKRHVQALEIAISDRLISKQ